MLPLLIAATGCMSRHRPAESHLLWYDRPAETWNEALPLGNGRLGVMVYGNPSVEQLQLNEESLWGGARVPDNNPTALENLAHIRKLVLDGRVPEAYELAERHLAGIPGKTWSYQTLGEIFFRFADSSVAITDYRRQLDMAAGIASVSYVRGGNRISYEIFAPAAEDLIVITMRAARAGGLDMEVTMERPQDAVITASGNRIDMSGRVTDPDDPERGPGGEHMGFFASLMVMSHDGELTAGERSLTLTGGKELTLLFNAHTDYNPEKLNYDRTIDPAKRCMEALSKASIRSLTRIRKEHLREHSSLFGRVTLSLGCDQKLTALPTDERLRRVQQGGDDAALLADYFQYGRYLLMASSRPPATLPANLQGIWNKEINAPWNSDYHTNINLQMNYWPAEVCNLSETAEVVISFVERLTVPGSVTARESYGSQGWTMHHTTDIFGKTAVLDGVYWGMFPMGGPWMTLPLWEHFLFTGDTAFLRERAYPVMKGAAEFITGFLVEGPGGALVTLPSYSPENSYIDPVSGKEFKLTYAPTMDNQIIREVLGSCRQAAETLGTDHEWAASLQEIITRVPPDRVGGNGTLMEWIEEYEEAEPGHRHFSHLFALHPGTQVTPERPDLFVAARRTLERRLAHGGGHTGWSRAWLINFYARLRDGDEAHRHLTLLLQRSTLPNLFDDHPPFQIDGNFGGTAGIAEMLLQSHNGVVHILPALPAQWPDGEVTGLRARGNFEVSVRWHEGMAEEITVKSHSGAPLTLACRNKLIRTATARGETLRFDGDLKQLK